MTSAPEAERGSSLASQLARTSSVTLRGPVCSSLVTSLQPGPVGTNAGSGRSARAGVLAVKSQSSPAGRGLLGGKF